MEFLFIVVGGIAALALVGIVLFMLNRSWGDFPSKVGTLPPEPFVQQTQLPKVTDLKEAPLQSDVQAAGMVLIEHHLVLRAAEDALRKGGSYARYLVRGADGQLYFHFDQIANPAERQAAFDLMGRFQRGEDVDMQAMLALVRRLGQQ